MWNDYIRNGGAKYSLDSQTEIVQFGSCCPDLEGSIPSLPVKKTIAPDIPQIPFQRHRYAPSKCSVTIEKLQYNHRPIP